jgi:hypothetical protein
MKKHRKRKEQKKNESGLQAEENVIENTIDSQLTGLALNSLQLDELCKDNYEAE